jgi:hypothetical protein
MGPSPFDIKVKASSALEAMQAGKGSYEVRVAHDKEDLRQLLPALVRRTLQLFSVFNREIQIEIVNGVHSNFEWDPRIELGDSGVAIRISLDEPWLSNQPSRFMYAVLTRANDGAFVDRESYEEIDDAIAGAAKHYAAWLVNQYRQEKA